MKRYEGIVLFDAMSSNHTTMTAPAAATRRQRIRRSQRPLCSTILFLFFCCCCFSCFALAFSNGKALSARALPQRPRRCCWHSHGRGGSASGRTTGAARLPFTTKASATQATPRVAVPGSASDRPRSSVVDKSAPVGHRVVADAAAAPRQRRGPQAPHPPWQLHQPQHLVRRIVTFRHDDGTAAIPAQAYRATTPVPNRWWGGGRDLPATETAQAVPIQSLLQLLHQRKGSACDDADADRNNNNNNSTTAAVEKHPLLQQQQYTLSKSSVALLDRWDILSHKEQHQLRMKIYKEQLASTPLSVNDRAQSPGDSSGPLLEEEEDGGVLSILYRDEHLCVCVKPSGVLSVPGPRRNPNLADLVYDFIKPPQLASVDSMIVHRLDMDTSGIVVYALSSVALRQLHADFRSSENPRRVHKTYAALLHGHVTLSSQSSSSLWGCHEAEMDVALERDPDHVPFMRIAQQQQHVPEQHHDSDDTNTEGSDKILSAQLKSDAFQHLKHDPKPSLTDVEIVGYEYLPLPSATKDDQDADAPAAASAAIPVTRVRLTPHTGRTHQLRVHAASALGHAIVGDDVYGGGADEEDLAASASVALCLCAQRLCLYHPVTGAPMEFSCVPPF
jgi:tRNA pseudouridine32 synthase / 23S rRNA pseudouridine746 synthase